VNRTIVHADLDAFYASVEQLDNPTLKGQPTVVGGPPESRGVVMAASYEARRFGIRSAMPMSRAFRLCRSLRRVPPRFDRYSEISRDVMSTFRQVTPLVEPMSLDEAFLDATAQVEDYGGAEALGQHLKRTVKQKTGLTLSVGIGTNKLVAKVASDIEKPDGLLIVLAGGEAAFLAPMKVRALWGVGPKTEAVLIAAGFTTVGQLAAEAPESLEKLFGSRGQWFHAMARGLDSSPVVTEHERKSVGAETTFPRDLHDGPELRSELARLVETVSRRLRRSGSLCRTVVLKLRYTNFRTITRQASRPQPFGDAHEIMAIAGSLLDVVATETDRFRLVGVHCTNLVTEDSARRDQLGLWAQEQPAETPA
jgi:DNA polymerase-4